MLEEFAMEKKSSGRSVQAPVKGNSTDSKKNQEASSSSKAFARTGRRREPLPPVGTKNDCRKPVPQKTKPHDKRPRAKGYFSGGKEGAQVAEDEVAVLGSVTVPGRRKQNLNHLLNFHYAPREGALSTPGSWRYQQGCGRKTISTYKHKYNKEQFLQANCQFVVRQANDYSAHLTNPDLLVEWDLIEEIHIRSGESLACPICLYPPVAAKITRCGHVYCWSCMLHYLALSDKDIRKCPICFEAVKKYDLKSVVPIMHNQYSVGEEITMRLMKRERGSLLPVPVDQGIVPASNKFLSVSERDVDIGYSKLLLASPEEVLSIITREKLELEEQQITDADCPEKCFVEQAIELLKERELLLLKESSRSRSILQSGKYSVDKPAACSSTSAHPVKQIQTKVGKSSWKVNDTTLVSEVNELPDSSESAQEINQIEENLLDIATHVNDCSESLEHEEEMVFSLDDIPSSAGGTPTKHFYFYQAADGQQIFLHALNVRMLEHHYGCLEHCPRILKGKILEIEAGSMTEELRKRLRYLQHLPVTCQFEVAEIHLRQPIVSKETLLSFEDQLENRKRRRQRRAKDERRRAKKIIEEERRLMGRFPSPSGICLDSHMQFPLCGTDPDLLGSSSPTSPSVSSAANSPNVESDIATNMNLLALENAGACYVEEVPDSPSGPSFAQMLREGKSKKGALQVPEQGSPMKNTYMENLGTFHRRRYSSAEYSEDPEDYVPVPDYKQSLEESISKAMENAAAVGEPMQGGDGTSGKKKKKKKQKILFATGMNFTNK